MFGAVKRGEVASVCKHHLGDMKTMPHMFLLHLYNPAKSTNHK